MGNEKVLVLAVGCVVAAGCIDEGRTLGVRENELGVAELDVERVDDARGNVFVLRALDSRANEIGHVRLTTGAIADLPSYLPTTELHGSELVVAMGSKEVRTVSRETQLHRVAQSAADILQLAEVQAALATANIFVDDDTDLTSEVAYDHTILTCPSSVLNASPTVGDCCYYTHQTFFINPANALVLRMQGPGACKASNGGSCSGSSCYYGPNGFARPTVRTPTSSAPYPAVGWAGDAFTGQFYCTQTMGTYNNAPYHAQTGTFPAGAGCCVNGSGSCDAPGRPLCSSCGGGGSAGRGSWDY